MYGRKRRRPVVESPVSESSNERRLGDERLHQTHWRAQTNARVRVEGVVEGDISDSSRALRV
ncbi:hypothetical protein E4P24_17095 [Haloferax sp. AS1]|nr:hypothetical protein [Haloferax sp. AS1]